MRKSALFLIIVLITQSFCELGLAKYPKGGTPPGSVGKLDYTMDIVGGMKSEEKEEAEEGKLEISDWEKLMEIQRLEEERKEKEKKKKTKKEKKRKLKKEGEKEYKEKHLHRRLENYENMLKRKLPGVFSLLTNSPSLRVIWDGLLVHKGPISKKLSKNRLAAHLTKKNFKMIDEFLNKSDICFRLLKEMALLKLKSNNLEDREKYEGEDIKLDLLKEKRSLEADALIINHLKGLFDSLKDHLSLKTIQKLVVDKITDRLASLFKGIEETVEALNEKKAHLLAQHDKLVSKQYIEGPHSYDRVIEGLKAEIKSIEDKLTFFNEGLAKWENELKTNLKAFLRGGKEKIEKEVLSDIKEMLKLIDQNEEIFFISRDEFKKQLARLKETIDNPSKDLYQEIVPKLGWDLFFSSGQSFAKTKNGNIYELSRKLQDKIKLVEDEINRESLKEEENIEKAETRFFEEWSPEEEKPFEQRLEEESKYLKNLLESEPEEEKEVKYFEDFDWSWKGAEVSERISKWWENVAEAQKTEYFLKVAAELKGEELTTAERKEIEEIVSERKKEEGEEPLGWGDNTIRDKIFKLIRHKAIEFKEDEMDYLIAFEKVMAVK